MCFQVCLASPENERWCPETESNRRHGDFQSPALPTELSGQRGALNVFFRRSSSVFFKKIELLPTLTTFTA
ncbi:hypothetical protein KPSA3_00382 [Pseudomonas syringae pv. actinidiae]|uniref:Uncharacterized protein n=1 Tax=Pseudomonas syringae pv. actinidiae TaxID=103796 RepID=A0AAN4TIQ9_PSESF|nr:hypothetical protein KPSA3_00382 [Pseudomonas syringae pv. actinidiae]